MYEFEQSSTWHNLDVLPLHGHSCLVSSLPKAVGAPTGRPASDPQDVPVWELVGVWFTQIETQQTNVSQDFDTLVSLYLHTHYDCTCNNSE